MKKKILLAITFCLFAFNAFANTCEPPTEEEIIMYWSNPNANPSLPRMPMEIPDVFLSDHSVSITGSHQDFTFELIDEDGNFVFQTQFLSSMTSVVVPNTISGSYELRLVSDNGYFYGLITL